MKAPTDEELLSCHLQGDPQAFRALVERYHRELFQFVYRFTGGKAVTDDVVQEVFLQVHLAGSGFDPTRRFKPWLFTIAANKARDYLRGRGRRREVALDAHMGNDDDSSQRYLDLLADEVAAPPALLESAEGVRDVRRVVDAMSPHLREVLILAYYHDLPYKDIATILSIPLGTVKSRLHAAIGQFGQRYRAEHSGGTAEAGQEPV